MNVSKKETRLNILSLLQYLYVNYQDYGKIDFHKITKQFKIGRSFYKILKDEVLINKGGSRGYYKWALSKPDLKMAETLHSIYIEDNKIKGKKAKEKRQLNVKVEKNNEINFIEKAPNWISSKELEKKQQEIKENKKRSISLFWGLIKIN